MRVRVNTGAEMFIKDSDIYIMNSKFQLECTDEQFFIKGELLCEFLFSRGQDEAELPGLLDLFWVDDLSSPPIPISSAGEGPFHRCFSPGGGCRELFSR